MTTTLTPFSGQHTIDASPLQGRLVDLEHGGMQGLRIDQEGFPTVVSVLVEAMPKSGTAAGIPQDVYDHFTMCNETVGLIDERLVAARPRRDRGAGLDTGGLRRKDRPRRGRPE